MNRLFVDMDGVLTDMEGYYLKLFGHKMDDAPSTQAMWDNMNSVEEFVYNLPPIPGAIEFFVALDRDVFDVYILTSASMSRNPTIAAQKVRWIKEHLDKDVLIIPVAESSHKRYFAQRPDDILIDDWGQNCREWEQAGGIAIKHEGTDYETTYARLLQCTTRRNKGVASGREYRGRNHPIPTPQWTPAIAP